MDQFLVPDWGVYCICIVGFGIQGCRTGPPGYKGWLAGATTLCRVDYMPQSGTKALAPVIRTCNLLSYSILQPAYEQTTYFATPYHLRPEILPLLIVTKPS
jgi:hypothetical protein